MAQKYEISVLRWNDKAGDSALHLSEWWRNFKSIFIVFFPPRSRWTDGRPTIVEW